VSDIKKAMDAMMKDLAIPSTITRVNYPCVDFTELDGNVFALIGAVSKAWRKVDRDVAERIGTVINSHAEDYDSALGFLLSITNCPDGDSDDE
jgi:hypothetical protein